MRQLLMKLAIVSIATVAAGSQFASINGLLCIWSKFVDARDNVKSKIECARLCDLTRKCQAFSMADGWCQLFVFDACSKNVRDCSCTRRAQVFVRQQPGLPPGALCPAGYADDSCGTKYKAYLGITSWDTYKATVEAESGLVIMADVMDSAELSYVRSLFSKYGLSAEFLGGRQLPGSPEPAGGWVWSSCNTSISSSLWTSGEPNNFGGTENVILAVSTHSGLNDGDISWSGMSGGLGECVAPFS